MLLKICAFIFAILFLVSVHEYGHYIVARLCNIKVLRFSIGFGKPFFKIKKGDTEWCLAPIPLGGYVKMVDTREDEKVAAEDLPYAFDKQHPLKRMAVVAAGPVVNLIVAVIFFAAVALYGITTIDPVVGMIIPDSLASRAGFQVGDKITSINGEQVKDFEDLNMKLTLAFDSHKEVIVSTQNNSQYKIDTQKESETIKKITLGKESIGIIPYKLSSVVDSIIENGAAYKAGLRNGDKITAINDKEMTSPYEITKIIKASPDVPLKVAFERSGKIHQITITPERVKVNPNEPEIGRIGTWWAEDLQWKKEISHTYTPTVFQAAYKGFKQTVDYSWLTVKFFGRMIIGQASLSHVSGPITIADLAGKTAETGLKNYIYFLAIISLSLGVMNLLPIPVLDGGHFVLYAFEWIFGKPISQNIQNIGVRLGIALLALLMCVAFFNDFVRLFG